MSVTAEKSPIVLRLDDVGACSKRYEIYSRVRKSLGPLGVPGDWLFLKYLPGLRAWGPYPEITADGWREVLDLVERHNALLTLGVTATWAEGEHKLTPFPEKFPQAAAVLKEACHRGLVEIANHGLTHCIVKGDVFKPKLFSGNRMYHREFSPMVPDDVQYEHLRRSQDILQSYFETEIVTFIPPGKQFRLALLKSAESVGLKFISYSMAENGIVLPIDFMRSWIYEEANGIQIEDEPWVPMPLLQRLLDTVNSMPTSSVIGFHDREIVLEGLPWLEEVLVGNKSSGFRLASDAGQAVDVEKLGR